MWWFAVTWRFRCIFIEMDAAIRVQFGGCSFIAGRVWININFSVENPLACQVLPGVSLFSLLALRWCGPNRLIYALSLLSFACRWIVHSEATSHTKIICFGVIFPVKRRSFSISQAYRFCGWSLLPWTARFHSASSLIFTNLAVLKGNVRQLSRIRFLASLSFLIVYMRYLCSLRAVHRFLWIVRWWSLPWSAGSDPYWRYLPS